MMKRPRGFLRGIDPGLEGPDDEKAVFIHHPRVHNPAFEIRVAVAYEGRLDQGCGHLSEAKARELVYLPARDIAAVNDLPDKLCRRKC